MTVSDRKFSIALLFDGKGGARELSDDEVARWSEADGLLWVDIDQGDKKARDWLLRDSGIRRQVSSILLAGETRPRSLIEQDGLLVIVRGINMNPGAVPDDMVAVRIWLEKNRIITSLRREVLSIRDVRDALVDGKGPKTAGEFLVELTGRLSVRIEAAVENIEQLIEELDAKLTAGDIESVRAQLGIVRRQAAAIRRHLSPQRDALDRMARATTGVLSDKEVFNLREEGDQLTRHIEDLDLARENALVTQEELMNKVAQEQNSRMYLLSVVAAIFLPLTFASGVLGMNVAGLPGTVNPNGFLVSAGVMLFLAVAMLVYFKYKRWI
ncbi:MAG: zinc transporter ZntB [Gammaproteobacteria bacterium]|nr:zinc transporter ZntB [Gammaproteobacteria bacterium]